MNKEAAPAREPYAAVVGRLQKLVEALEGGELPLEEALEKFGEGVDLVKRAERLLADAEKRVEQLLSDDKVAPLDVPASPAPAASKPKETHEPARTAAPSAKRPPAEDDNDVPF